MLFLELLDRGHEFGGVRQGIAAVRQFDLDQLLLDHRVRRGLLTRRAEIGLHAILESSHANLPIQIAGRDHAVAHRGGDAVDDLAARHGHVQCVSETQSAGLAPRVSKRLSDREEVLKVADPLHLALVRWWRRGSRPALIRSCCVPLNPKYVGPLMLYAKSTRNGPTGVR